jgi:ATP-dependent Clp protease ATP-binding subunit ClpC
MVAPLAIISIVAGHAHNNESSFFHLFQKAIDLLDEAGSIASLAHAAENEDEDDYDDDENFPIVDEHTVAMVISEWAAIPLGKLESSEMDRLVQLEEDMTQRIKGQGRAIQSVARAVRRARSGLRDPKRPIASFMFCGPTGTGKSYRGARFQGLDYSDLDVSIP